MAAPNPSASHLRVLHVSNLTRNVRAPHLKEIFGAAP